VYGRTERAGSACVCKREAKRFGGAKGNKSINEYLYIGEISVPGKWAASSHEQWCGRSFRASKQEDEEELLRIGARKQRRLTKPDS
jgi:hypothetical protein